MEGEAGERHRTGRLGFGEDVSEMGTVIFAVEFCITESFLFLISLSSDLIWMETSSFIVATVFI
jgi:hypothetical protein